MQHGELKSQITHISYSGSRLHKLCIFNSGQGLISRESVSLSLSRVFSRICVCTLMANIYQHRHGCLHITIRLYTYKQAEKDQPPHPRPSRFNLFCFFRRAPVTGASRRGIPRSASTFSFLLLAGHWNSIPLEHLISLESKNKIKKSLPICSKPRLILIFSQI